LASRSGTPPISIRLAAAPRKPPGALNSFSYSKRVLLPSTARSP
jgi:hypothetical protein